MKKITIKDGHLWRGIEKLELEFGNLEQIKALRDYERIISEFEIGIEPVVTYEVTAIAMFKCICENRLQTSSPVDNEGDIDEFENDTVRCHTCGRVYVCELEPEFGIRNGRSMRINETLLVKLKK